MADSPKAVTCLSRVRRSKRYALAVITFALFLDYLMLLAVIPILPAYATKLGLGSVELGLLFSIKPAVGVVASPIMGWASDRWGRRRPVVAGLFGSAAFLLMFGFSTRFDMIYCVNPLGR
jgi:DHA1 family multidrug resistance protein-like MFS transporter